MNALNCNILLKRKGDMVFENHARKMKITLKTWNQNEKAELMKICNNMNRMYLGNRIPEPYSEKDAEWWIDMAIKNEGENGVFRAILCEGEYVGNISIEKNKMFILKMQRLDIIC